MLNDGPTVIDLFCGAGGLSEGFRQAGCSVLFGNDNDEQAGLTFQQTHPEAHFSSAPVDELNVSDILDRTQLAVGDLDILVGGPPCQAYSVYNHQRGVNDVRSRLFEEYLRIVDSLRPKWIVMENVTGITSISNGAIVEEIFRRLSKLGYYVEARVLRAEDFGVPQERRRIFFVGNRVGADVRFPAATHGPQATPYVTIWDALGDLPSIENGGGHSKQSYNTPPLSTFQRYARSESTTVLNHVAPRLSPRNIERLKYIPIGGSWRDVPFELLPAGMKRAKRSDHTKRYGRMDPSKLSCTILTKCDIHWGAYIHPYDDRAITVREAARLQSFPDHYVFHGSRTEQYVQVGNAVPPLLARSVASAVVSQLQKFSGSVKSAA